MILQIKQENRKYQLPKAGKEKVTPSLSIPGQAFNLQYAMEEYKRGNLVDRAIGYYEKNGMEVPDVRMMDKIERMELLAQYRALIKQSQQNIERDFNVAKKKNNELVEKQKSEKAAAGQRGGEADKQSNTK